MGKTAFVTGGTGFVGINLVDQLCAGGWEVTALHRPTSDLIYLGRRAVRLVEGDITEPGSLERALPEGVDVVFHVAGNLNMWSRRNAEQIRDNVYGTRNVVARALAAKAGRLVHTSSIAAWGLPRGRIDESAPQRGGGAPINYLRTKYLAEEEVRKGLAQGLDAVILNPANIIGPYDRHGLARLIKLVHARKLPGVPPCEASFCHVREVAKAHLAAAEKGRRGENYLLGGADAAYLEVVRTVGEIAGRQVPVRVTPAPVLKAMGRLSQWASHVTGKEPTITPEIAKLVSRRLFCDSAKAERELGFKPVRLRAMFEDSYRWLANQGLLESRA